MLSANPEVAATARYTAAAPGEASGDKNQATAKMSLLIVDDEEAITASLARSLRHEYTIYTANSGAQALEILAHEQICMILTDQRMPGISGVELLEQARKLSPHSLGLLISGYSDPDALLKAINLGTVQGFIQKPWNIQDLRLRLAELAEHYRMNNHPAA